MGLLNLSSGIQLEESYLINHSFTPRCKEQRETIFASSSRSDVVLSNIYGAEEWFGLTLQSSRFKSKRLDDAETLAGVGCRTSVIRVEATVALA